MSKVSTQEGKVTSSYQHSPLKNLLIKIYHP